MELNHLDFSHGVAYIPKVSSTQHKYEVALAAVKNIPGGTETVHNTFKQRPVNIPFQIEPKKMYDMDMHHIIGEAYH